MQYCNTSTSADMMLSLFKHFVILRLSTSMPSQQRQTNGHWASFASSFCQVNPSQGPQQYSGGTWLGKSRSALAFNRINFASSISIFINICAGSSPFLDEEDDHQRTLCNVSTWVLWESCETRQKLDHGASPRAKYDFDYEEFDSVSAEAKDFISRLLRKRADDRMNSARYKRNMIH